MKLRQLFEAPRKVAVAAFGRMNPPTIGHEKLVEKIKSFDGDHYLFLSQTQKPKDNPLPFDVKLQFSKQFFPSVNVGHPTVRTPIQMLQMLEKLGYTDIIYVAGSDRVESFTKLFNDYNGKEYNFDSIEVVSAGERDPDADGAEGMSASKMRAAAASGDYEAFAQGVPTPALAQKLYDAVRKGMGVKDTAPTEGVAEGKKHISPSGVETDMKPSDDDYAINYGKDGSVAKFRKSQGLDVKTGNKKTKEAAYEGNLGLMELFAFFSKAEKTDPELVAKVKSLIKQGQDKQVWNIVQNYTGTKLVGKEFEGSIAEAIIERACKSKSKSKSRG